MSDSPASRVEAIHDEQGYRNVRRMLGRPADDRTVRVATARDLKRQVPARTVAPKLRHALDNPPDRLGVLILVTEQAADAQIALGSARLALPVAAAERQRVLAVGVLSCERVLADLDRRSPGSLEEESRVALAQVPHAAEWATRFTSAAPRSALSAKRFRQHAAPAIVRTAASGIAQACVPDPDGMLRDLLIGAIEACTAWTRRDPDPDPTLNLAVWAAACQRTEGSGVPDAIRSEALASLLFAGRRPAGPG